MQAIGNSSLLGAGQTQRLLGMLLQQQTKSTGQTSPLGADDAAAPAAPASLTPAQGPGQQFASATLASLLSLQQQQPAQPPSAGDLASALIGQADTNGDGALSADEITSVLAQNGGAAPGSDAVTSAIGKLDSNGDGKLSASELTAGLDTLRKAHGHHHHSQQAASSTDLASKLLGKADTNGDGGLSADEISAQLTAKGASVSSQDLTAAIGKLDTNGDGTLSGAELTAAIDAFRKAHDGSGSPTTAAAANTDSATTSAAA
ncbi:MAG: calcium-binding protein [Phenylobacterium sp.]|nr:calcium-binding protein [Phenylobacterium sp.]